MSAGRSLDFRFSLFWRKLLPPDALKHNGTLDCLDFCAVTAPLYMAVGPLVYDDGHELPHGPIPWILTAAVLMGIWELAIWA